MNRILIVEPQRCDGCGECVPACQRARSSVPANGVACLRLISLPEERLWFPLVCQQCEQPPCVLTCPTGALSTTQTMNVVELDHDRCVGCGMCLVSCPFGAIQLDAEMKKARKCDLCKGAPACVRECKRGALAFPEPHRLGGGRRSAAGASIVRVTGGRR